jgi:hypothetical protein
MVKRPFRLLELRSRSRGAGVIPNGEYHRDRVGEPGQIRARAAASILLPSLPVALPKLTRPKQLTPHHVEDPNALAVKTIKDPAGWLDNLPVVFLRVVGDPYTPRMFP